MKVATLTIFYNLPSTLKLLPNLILKRMQQSLVYIATENFFALKHAMC
jgi:hypothetical protein